MEWLKDGLPVLGEHRYRTRLDDGLASLEVLNASPGDSAEFTCVARNLHGEASSTATLKVFAGFEPAPSPPTFTRAIKGKFSYKESVLVHRMLAALVVRLSLRISIWYTQLTRRELKVGDL